MEFWILYFLFFNFDEVLKMLILIIFYNNKGKNINLIFIFSLNYFKVFLMYYVILFSSVVDCSDCKNFKIWDFLMCFF